MPPPKPINIQSFAFFLERYCITKNLLNLRLCHCQAIKLGFSHNEFIRAKFVSSYSSCGQMADARLIFYFSDRKCTFLYNTLIRGYASTKDYQLSLSTFHKMLLSSITLDLNTLPAVLKSVAALSFLTLGQQLHSLALILGFTSDLAHNNALITMYSKCGNLVSARKVFDYMHESNLITWSAIMSGYAIHGEFEEVVWMFDRMLNLGFWPDKMAFTIVLTACNHGGKVGEGKKYFEMMVDKFGLTRSIEHYTCMVDMLGRAGKINDAKQIIDSMEMEPDEGLWRAFLGSCSKYGKLGITVRGKVFRLVD